MGFIKAFEEFFVNFEPMNFISNLSYMLYGMLGIFIVILIIILITVILNKITEKRK